MISDVLQPLDEKKSSNSYHHSQYFPGTFVLPILILLGFVRLEVFISPGSALFPRHLARILLNYKFSSQ